MSSTKKELLARAEDVMDALTDAYGAKSKPLNKMLINGLGTLALGAADIAINGLKAQTSLLPLYQLFQANSQPLPKMAPQLQPDLAPQLRNHAWPRPRPY